jgi:PhnB protein
MSARVAAVAMPSIQTELWVSNPRSAIAFYEAAFDAATMHVVGEGDDLVAQLRVGESEFWVAPASTAWKRLDPQVVDGRTNRTLLVVSDPDAVFAQAVAAGATESSPVANEHGWRVGRVVDPFGHEWEIGKPVIPWPPSGV